MEEVKKEITETLEALEAAKSGEPDQSNDMMEKLEKLSSVLEAEKSVAAALNVENLTKRADSYLSDASKALLAIDFKPKSLVVTDGESGRVAVAVYYSTVVTEDNVDRALLLLSANINDLVAKGYVHSFLAPPSSLKLVRQFGQQPVEAVFVFPMVYAEYKDIASKYFFSHKEGEVPANVLGNTSTILKDGEFLADIRLTVGSNMLGEYNTKEDEKSPIDHKIDEYLKYLPKGTKLVSVEKCGVTDLSLPYEVKFYNSLLPDIKKVDLNFIRKAVIIDDKLIQFNLFTGVNYYTSLDQKMPNF